jgi:hypothetical protein
MAAIKRQTPLVIHLPAMPDRTIFEIRRCLDALVEAFESRYGLQIWCDYDQHPLHKHPARFRGEPF